MSTFVTGETIRILRENAGLTQKQLADQLCLSDKTISKWETNRGLPDITLISPLAAALGVSVSELLSGQWAQNRNRGGNLLRSKFYVCPVCGNILHAMGDGAYSCCGVSLPPLEAEAEDDEHRMVIEGVENEHFITVSHPMTKEHHLSFIAWVTGDRLTLVKWYPEGNAETRIQLRGHGILYICCNRDGLFMRRV
ncbi:MAG: helix-turn-helix domain-containing protein [Clostridia bacterium]|nr:helix-turn-helix domain-containing protein [Clostridia bacterium]